jgi:hypothetical protein
MKDKLTSIFDKSMFSSMAKDMEDHVNETDKKDLKKKTDLFSNIEDQPNNIQTSGTSESYPAMQGLVPPTHLNNPERTTGNGKGGIIARKTINKSASVLIKFAFSSFPDATLQRLIAAIMGDSSLDFNTKQQITNILQQQPQSVIQRLANIPGIGFMTGAGVGALIAKFLLGSSLPGLILGSGIGGYIGNNLQNRHNSLTSPISSNPFANNFSYTPTNNSNPFIIL